MVSITLISTLFLAQTAIGPLGEVRTVVAPAVCDVCGARFAAIDATIARLKASPRAHDREDAAEDLARFRWTCHPEIVVALADALRFDPRGGVREEAADSLARLGVREPEAHLALRRAAISDRDGGVRHSAREALRSLPSRCLADCPICGPLPVASQGASPTIEVIGPGSIRVIKSGSASSVGPISPKVSRPRDDTPPPPPAPAILSERSTTVTPPLPGPSTPIGSSVRSPSVPPTDLPALTPPVVSSSRPASATAPAVPTVPSVRRSSAKPVDPPTDLPPLEGPTR